MLPTGWARLAQSLRTSSWSSFRGLHAANTQARIMSSFRPSFTAQFSSLRSVSPLVSPRASLFARRSLLHKSAYRKSFDPRFFSSSKASESVAADLPILSPPPVGLWLLGSSVLVFAVIVVGGVTRLTESGLSITEWRPVTGILPPLSKAEWEAEFDKYKLTPEYKLSVYASYCYCVSNDRIGSTTQSTWTSSNAYSTWNGVIVSSDVLSVSHLSFLSVTLRYANASLGPWPRTSSAWPF